MVEIKHRLTGAVLATVDAVSLGGAYLGDADLRDADLGDADLRGADLGGAYLGGADLGGADLGGADLADADLADANLADAYLADANLRGAYLAGAYLGDANLGDVLDGVPAIESIDAAILAAVEASQALGKDGLRMSTWHTCESTHCRAGWAIHLAGNEGYELEREYGPAMAGTLIYLKAGATRIPDWYASDDAAMADLRERAGAA